MSGSAKAGTTAERHRCELRILAGSFARAPPKRASGELCFPLTKTYMDVGKPEVMKPTGCLHVLGSDSVLYSHSKRLFTAARVYKSRSSHTLFVHLALRSCSLG